MPKDNGPCPQKTAIEYPERPRKQYKFAAVDFIPKKKMKYHTLEEPIEYYSENEAEDELIHLEDEGCGCDTACNCYDTTIYDL